MKLAVSLGFSLAPFALFAQTLAPNPAGPVQTDALYVAPWSNISGCPVSLRAEQMSSVNMRQVHQAQPQAIGQRLHLTLTNPDSKQIVAATVMVRGFTFTPRMQNTVAKKAGNASSYATRSLDVTFLPQTGKAVSADVQVPGVTAAQSIDLVSLTYADGSGWKLAEGASCRIAPDPLMLVGTQRRN